MNLRSQNNSSFDSFNKKNIREVMKMHDISEKQQQLQDVPQYPASHFSFYEQSLSLIQQTPPPPKNNRRKRNIFPSKPNRTNKTSSFNKEVRTNSIPDNNFTRTKTSDPLNPLHLLSPSQPVYEHKKQNFQDRIYQNIETNTLASKTSPLTKNPLLTTLPYKQDPKASPTFILDNSRSQTNNPTTNFILDNRHHKTYYNPKQYPLSSYRSENYPSKYKEPTNYSKLIRQYESTNFPAPSQIKQYAPKYTSSSPIQTQSQIYPNKWRQRERVSLIQDKLSLHQQQIADLRRKIKQFQKNNYQQQKNILTNLITKQQALCNKQIQLNQQLKKIINLEAQSIQNTNKINTIKQQLQQSNKKKIQKLTQTNINSKIGSNKEQNRNIVSFKNLNNQSISVLYPGGVAKQHNNIQKLLSPFAFSSYLY